MQVIVYKRDDGGVSVINPIQEYVDKYGINAIAQKVVSFGKPYKIINVIDLPSRENRDAWAVLETDLNDGIGSESNEFN